MLKSFKSYLIIRLKSFYRELGPYAYFKIAISVILISLLLKIITSNSYFGLEFIALISFLLIINNDKRQDWQLLNFLWLKKIHKILFVEYMLIIFPIIIYLIVYHQYYLLILLFCSTIIASQRSKEEITTYANTFDNLLTPQKGDLHLISGLRLYEKKIIAIFLFYSLAFFVWLINPLFEIQFVASIYIIAQSIIFSYIISKAEPPFIYLLKKGEVFSVKKFFKLLVLIIKHFFVLLLPLLLTLIIGRVVRDYNISYIVYVSMLTVICLINLVLVYLNKKFTLIYKKIIISVNIGLLTISIVNPFFVILYLILLFYLFFDFKFTNEPL
ncbi:MAG: hypothetical protein EO766_09030 [Hydrotalea sp. AMD]|uniref:hypothetical protein n=1 Tax=Hydrotalea sp. AMD TaxID=2501297 RepID=UPI000945C927|nr:hypothetical protein [Hydrotalea sp. AMD]RTL48686.1 MAG: hypothetical protein EKK39_12080 [Sphingobacteriales bacterium]RWZ88126.1 MAG: hypothetical protein EO766_09030 [Hydrotalea sp. AMD]